MNAESSSPDLSMRLLRLAYLLIWPLALAAVLRPSAGDAVLLWWSRRALLVVIGTLGLLAAATVVLWRSRADNDGRVWIERWVAQLRGRRTLMIVAGVAPLAAWCGLAGYLAYIQAPLSLSIFVSMLDAALLALVWIAALSFLDRPPREQRLLAMKWTLAAASLLISLALLEGAGAILRLTPYAHWRINPPNLDTRLITDDFDVAIRTNEQGLREDQPVATTKSIKRVLVIGDSMTFGWGVEANEAYPRVTERLLREKRGELQVVNMGRPGASPSDYLRFARRYARRLKPDVVVIGFLVGNDCPVTAPPSLLREADVERAAAYHRATAAPTFAERWLGWSFLLRTFSRVSSPASRASDDGVRGAIFGEPNPLGERVIASEIGDDDDARQRFEHLKKLGWVEKGLKWRINPWLIRSVVLHPAGAADTLASRSATLEPMKYEWMLCERLLAQIHAEVRSMEAELVVLAIPNAHLVSSRWVSFLEELGCEVNGEMTVTRVVNDWLAEFCERERITLIDPLDDFRRREETRGGLYLRTDDHLTPAGQQRLAEALAEGLAPVLNRLKER